MIFSNYDDNDVNDDISDTDSSYQQIIYTMLVTGIPHAGVDYFLYS